MVKTYEKLVAGRNKKEKRKTKAQTCIKMRHTHRRPFALLEKVAGKMILPQNADTRSGKRVGWWESTGTGGRGARADGEGD